MSSSPPAHTDHDGADADATTAPDVDAGGGATVTTSAAPRIAAGAGARKSTVLVMLATMLTKIVGLARETLAAYYFGVGAVFTAFTVAFQLPNVVRTFVADQALVGSLVPVFTDLRENDEEERAWRVASTVVSVLLILLVPATALAMLAARFFIDFAVYDKFQEMDLAVTLFRILVPIVMAMSLGGVVIAILNSYGKFGAPAFAQLLFNFVSVGVLVFGSFVVDHDHRIHLYAGSILVATITQALMPAPWLRGHGRRLMLGRAFGDPAVKAVMLAMLPVMLSLAAMNLNNIVNTYWSSRISTAKLLGVADSGPGIVYRAWSLFQLPQGIFSLAVATVFLPLFARYAARGDHEGFRDATTASIRQIVVLLMPATLFMVVLAQPISELVFGYGKCDANCSTLIASATRGFAIGLISNGAIQLLMRAFFSQQTPWTPAIIGFIANLGGNIVISGLLHERLGVFGVTFSVTLANTMSFLTMWYVLRRRVGGMSMWPVLSAMAMSGGAAAVSVLAGWGIYDGSTTGLGNGFVVRAIAMVLAVVVTWSLYAAFALKLRLVNVPQLRAILKRGR